MDIKKQTELFKKYSKVRIAQIQLELREKALKEEILKGLDRSITSSYGIFTPVLKTNWKYSKKTTQMEQEAKTEIKTFSEEKLKLIKATKQLEEANGTAKGEIIKTMQYRGAKP